MRQKFTAALLAVLLALTLLGCAQPAQPTATPAPQPTGGHG